MGTASPTCFFRLNTLHKEQDEPPGFCHRKCRPSGAELLRGLRELTTAGACSWAQSEGQDFIGNHQTPSIDYITFHSWADNWFDDDLSFQQAWIQQHVADAANIGKPVRVLRVFPVRLAPSSRPGCCYDAAGNACLDMRAASNPPHLEAGMFYFFTCMLPDLEVCATMRAYSGRRG